MKTNEELRKDVMDELKWDPQLREVSTQIGVSAKDGLVTLSGLVDAYSKKIAIEKAAQRVAGVKVIASDIEVKIGMLRKKTDIEIAEVVKNALQWNSAVNDDEIEAKVDNGWVYLEGKVNWEFERISAQQSVENLVGVRGVINSISLKPNPIDTVSIKDKIAEAFKRSATVDSSSIKVETSGTKITLRGKVRSWAEKKDAEQVAWSSPGVMSVDNQIEIDVAVYA